EDVPRAARISQESLFGRRLYDVRADGRPAQIAVASGSQAGSRVVKGRRRGQFRACEFLAAGESDGRTQSDGADGQVRTRLIGVPDVNDGHCGACPFSLVPDGAGRRAGPPATWSRPTSPVAPDIVLARGARAAGG